MTHRLTVPLLIAAGLLAGVAGTPLFGQQVFTELRDPAQVRAFQHVSNGLICQCGCNLVLSTCAHVDCPFAIPIRRFIEDRIVEGMPADSVLAKMQHGFGPAIKNDPRVSSLGSMGRDDLVNGLVHGFGTKVSAHTSPAVPILLVASFSGLAFALFLFWRKRKRSRPPGTGATGTEQAAPNEVRDALSQLRDIQK